MEKLDAFVRKLRKMNINLEFSLNFPWIYVTKINGKIITEKFGSEHGWVIGFYPIREGQHFEFDNIFELFKLIRKYK